MDDRVHGQPKSQEKAWLLKKSAAAYAASESRMNVCSNILFFNHNLNMCQPIIR